MVQVLPLLLSTNGTEVVTVSGTGFGPVGAAYRPAVHLGSLTFTNCTVTTADVELSCTTVPGSSAGPLTTTVEVAHSLSSAPTIRYRAPCLSRVVLSTSDGMASTTGGDTVLVYGRNFGEVGSPVDFVVYGASVALYSEAVIDSGVAPQALVGSPALASAIGSSADPQSTLHVAQNCSVTLSHSTVTCKTSPGAGAGHVWALSIRGATATLCSDSSITNVTTRYSPPHVTAVSVTDFLDNPGGGLQTEGGSTVVVRGVNFGPAGSGARVYVAGVGVSSFVVVNDSSARFVGVAGFGANRSVVVEVGGQVSNSDVAVSYAVPTVQSVSVLPGSTAASKLLEVSGVNMGRSCVGCLPVGQQPSLCAAGACNSSASVCGGGSSPVVTVWSVPGMAGYPCDVLCVAPASSTVTSITCRTAFPFRTGAVSVNVSGLVSATVGVDYDELLSEPEVHSASPSTCASVGCHVTLSGVKLASTEVLVSNALSAWVVSTLSNNGTSISFSLGAGQGMVSVGVRVIGTSVVSNVIQYWYTAGVVSSVSPLSGGTSGGVVVIVNGTNLGSALAVTTPLGCNAVNRVWIGPWVCAVVEVSACVWCVCVLCVL